MLKQGFEGDPEKIEQLSATAYTVMIERDDFLLRRMCRHCAEPSCVSVCPVGALEKTKDGPVTYDADKCMGCRYCIMACPFSVPRYQWSRAVPTVRKCNLCFDRVSDGKKPNCTRFCKEGAITFGDRDELMATARARITASPDRYHGEIYGEKEAGGTSLLMIAAVPPAALGLPVNVPTEPLPQRTWEVLSRLPGVVAAGAAFLLGTWWVIERRNKVAAERVTGEMDLVPEKSREEVTS